MIKKFLAKVSVFLVIVFACFVALLSSADGKTDAYYLRFTSSRQSNLILGTSRAAQSLQPTVFDSVLHRNFFNYSFTLIHSPYGPVYISSIKKKLSPETQNGIFIVTVDPWSISSSTDDPDDSLTFIENNLCVATTTYVNLKPNYDYLINSYGGKFYQLFRDQNDGGELHEDGWLEVNLPMDSLSVANRIKAKLIDYNKNLKLYKFSRIRLKSLVATIQFLKTHGAVYIVRLPVHQEIFRIEEKFMNDFQHRIKDAIAMSDGYYNMTDLNNEFQYTDGNHLYKESGKLVSHRIAKWINMGN